MTICAATTDAPAGSEKAYDARKPIMKAIADSTAASTDTIRYDLDTSMAVVAGNIIREEISREPSMRIPTTIMTAVSTASIDV